MAGQWPGSARENCRSCNKAVMEFSLSSYPEPNSGPTITFALQDSVVPAMGVKVNHLDGWKVSAE